MVNKNKPAGAGQAGTGGTRRGRARRGFTIMEVMFAVAIFTLMGIMFGAVFPMTIRAGQHANNYAQAALLAQRKIDQLRWANYGRITDDAQGTALNKLTALDIVDGQNADGSYDFTSVDKLTGAGGFFTAPAAGQAGTITVGDYSADTTGPDAGNAGNLPGAGNAALVTVTLAWGGKDPGTYSASALIIQMGHQ
jgi:prepilin-type N-terminal cleavage/methylation domain-containing protein